MSIDISNINSYYFTTNVEINSSYSSKEFFYSGATWIIKIENITNNSMDIKFSYVGNPQNTSSVRLSINNGSKNEYFNIDRKNHYIHNYSLDKFYNKNFCLYKFQYDSIETIHEITVGITLLNNSIDYSYHQYFSEKVIPENYTLLPSVSSYNNVYIHEIEGKQYIYSKYIDQINNFNNFIQEYSDVEFEIGKHQKIIKAHRVILASRCPSFKNLFEEQALHNNISNGILKITLPNHNYTSFKALIDYHYKGKCYIPKSRKVLDDLLNLAYQYNVNNLIETIEEELANPENNYLEEENEEIDSDDFENKEINSNDQDIHLFKLDSILKSKNLKYQKYSNGQLKRKRELNEIDDVLLSNDHINIKNKIYSKEKYKTIRLTEEGEEYYDKFNCSGMEKQSIEGIDSNENMFNNTRFIENGLSYGEDSTLNEIDSEESDQQLTKDIEVDIIDVESGLSDSNSEERMSENDGDVEEYETDRIEINESLDEIISISDDNMYETVNHSVEFDDNKEKNESDYENGYGEEIEKVENEEIKNEEIKNEKIENEEIQNEEIQNEEIQNEEIENEEIQNEEIQNEEIQNEEIENEEIEDEEVENDEIENEEIENEEIENGEIENEEIKNEEIENKEIENGEIENGEIENEEIENGEIENEEIENEEIENGEIENGEIENEEIENDEIENEEIENEEIENEEIENEEIENKVENEEVKSEEIESEEIEYEELENNEIENEVIENEEIEYEEIENEKLENEEIENGELENDELKNDELKNNELKNDELENDEIENDEIENDEIENDEIENDEIENDEIENDEIDNDEIDNDEIDNDEIGYEEVKNEEIENEGEFEELENQVEIKEFEEEGEIEIENDDNYKNNESDEDSYSTSEKDILKKKKCMNSIPLSGTKSDEIYQEDENIEDIHESFINNNKYQSENEKMFNNEENINEVIEINNENENKDENKDEDENKKDKSSENLYILEDCEEGYDSSIKDKEIDTYENTNEENYFDMDLNNIIPLKEHLNIEHDIDEFYNASKKKRNKEYYNENYELNNEVIDNQINNELNYENVTFFNDEFELEKHQDNNEVHDNQNEVIDHENDTNKVLQDENTRVNDNISDIENINNGLNQPLSYEQPQIELEQYHDEHQQSDEHQVEDNQINEIENHNKDEEQDIEENHNKNVEIQHFNENEQFIEENQNDEMENQRTNEDEQYIKENQNNSVEIQQSNEIEKLIGKNQNKEIEKHIEMGHNENLKDQSQIEEQLVKEYHFNNLEDHHFKNNISNKNQYENIGDNETQNIHEEHFYEDGNNDLEDNLYENNINNTENTNEEENIDSLQLVEDYNNNNDSNDNEDIYNSLENKDLTTKEILFSIEQNNKREITFNNSNSKNDKDNKDNKLDDIILEEHQTLVNSIVNDIEEDNYDSLEVDTYINDEDNIEDVNVENINIEDVYNEDYIQPSMEEDHMSEVNEIIIEDTNECEINNDLISEETKNYCFNGMEEDQNLDVMMDDSKDEELNNQIMYIETLNFKQETFHRCYNESIFNETF